MNKVAKFIAVSVALLLTGVSSAGNAFAEEWRHRDGGDALAVGMLGLAVGVIAGSIISDHPHDPAGARVYVAHGQDRWDRDQRDGGWRDRNRCDSGWRGGDRRVGDWNGRSADRQMQPWTRDWNR
jgi:hypothetical protein